MRAGTTGSGYAPGATLPSIGTASTHRANSGKTIVHCRNSEIPLAAAAQFALIEIALFILGTPTDLKEMLPDTSSQRAEPAPSFHQY
jgi:hypothetical protein